MYISTKSYAGRTAKLSWDSSCAALGHTIFMAGSDSPEFPARVELRAPTCGPVRLRASHLLPPIA